MLVLTRTQHHGRTGAPVGALTKAIHNKYNGPISDHMSIWPLVMHYFSKKKKDNTHLGGLSKCSKNLEGNTYVAQWIGALIEGIQWSRDHLSVDFAVFVIVYIYVLIYSTDKWSRPFCIPPIHCVPSYRVTEPMYLYIQKSYTLDLYKANFALLGFSAATPTVLTEGWLYSF